MIVSSDSIRYSHQVFFLHAIPREKHLLQNEFDLHKNDEPNLLFAYILPTSTE